MPQATGVNMGLQGSQVNLGTQGGMEQGGLVSLASGTEDSTLGTLSTQNLVKYLQDRQLGDTTIIDDLKKQREEIGTALGKLPTKQDRIDRAQERKMQALYASLIAGGAGVLGADPQRGYAAAVGEGIQAGLPVAASGMEDYYEALDEADATEVTNLIQKYTLARDASKDYETRQALDLQLATLLHDIHDPYSQRGGIDMVAGEAYLVEQPWFEGEGGFELGSEEEVLEKRRILNKARQLTREHLKGLDRQPGDEATQELFEGFIDQVLQAGPEVEELDLGDSNAAIAAASENIPTVADVDAQYGDPPKSPSLMRGGSRGEAIRRANEERIAKEKEAEERRARLGAQGKGRGMRGMGDN